jgi:hypothetical protein
MLFVNNKALKFKVVCRLFSCKVESLIYMVFVALFRMMVVWPFSVTLCVIAKFSVCFIIILKDLTVDGVSCYFRCLCGVMNLNLF